MEMEKFSTWLGLIDHIRKHQLEPGEDGSFVAGCYLAYKAPMDAKPASVWCAIRGQVNTQKVYVRPHCCYGCDPFWAESGHLNRFLKPIERTEQAWAGFGWGV